MDNVTKAAEFTPFHIDLVWRVLHTRFGFNTREWQFRFADYREELRKKRRDLDHDPVSDFNRFGNQVINPVLNDILCRREHHPTFNNLIDYVIKEKMS